jgi:hypothetical protein
MNQEEAKKLLKSLSTPGIAQFLDTRKLYESDHFTVMTDCALDHMIQHGDCRFIELIMRLFADSGRFEHIVKWLCARAGLEFSFNDGDCFCLRKDRNSPPQPDAALSKYESSATGKGTAAAMARASQKKRSSPKRGSQDAMTRWRVLPGCFGHGKRQ